MTRLWMHRVAGWPSGKFDCGLRAVYRTLELPSANPLKDVPAALDAARLARHEPVTAYGLPPAYPNPQSLISDDCIRPAS